MVSFQTSNESSVRGLKGLCLFLLWSALVPAGYASSVTSSSADGFTIEHSFEVRATAALAYQAFTEKIGRWWGPEHTYSGNSQNMAIEARANGCFCERWGAGAGIVHMTVLYVDPNKTIRFSGGLGPLQEMAVSGVMTVDFMEEGGRTKVLFKYAISGRAALELDKVAPLVDRVLVEQMNRFESFVDTGKPQ